MASTPTPINEELVFDAWTSLSFKRALGSRITGGHSWLQPTWVGNHARRLQAYKVLHAYRENAARFFLQTTDMAERDAHREYGDGALIVNQVLAALLGDDQQIVVEGADDFDPDFDPTDENNDPDAAEANSEAEAALELQEWLQQWAKDERLGLKKIESERNSVSLGDGVYSLGWNRDKERPRLRVWDPGFYFPVLDDGNEDDYPGTVHIAWELEEEESKPGKRQVRRITWQIGNIGRVPGTGDVRNDVTAPTRLYPWNDKPSRVTCYMTDATWEFDKSGKQTIDDFTEAAALYAVYEDENGVEIPWRNIDLGIDFVPVVHMPNTVAILDHYGKSTLATVLQILDDISNADTDLQAASSTTGKPPIALSGVVVGNSSPTYKAGEVWKLGENGKLSILDTSTALDALIKYIQFLLKRLSVNSRIPETVLGRTEISGDIAGITLALSFGPLETMVKEMRLVRDEKDPLILKFAHRIALAAGMPDVPERWVDSRLEYGSFLPDDIDTTVKTVTQLLAAKAISLETAVLLLVSAGMPVDDAAEEVRRIQERDFKGAGELLDATGDEDAVFEYLGLEPPTTLPAPPVPIVPVLPGQPPVPPAPTPPAPGVNPNLPPAPPGGNVAP